MTKARHMRPPMHNTLVLRITFANIAINNISQKLHSLAYISAAESISVSSTTLRNPSEFDQITVRLGLVGAITPFKVIQDQRFWYQSKAHMRLLISD